MKMQQNFTLFLWRKCSSFLPQAYHSTQNTILAKLLLWEYSNKSVPFSWRKSSIVSRLVRTSRVSRLCIRHMPTYTCQDELKPPKASSILMCVAYMGKPMSLRWHGSRQSHRNDHSHNKAWICTYSNCLEHIPTLQGQKSSWLAKVAHLATRVHHTKCTITHIQTHIDIHTSSTMLSHRVGK